MQGIDKGTNANVGNSTRFSHDNESLWRGRGQDAIINEVHARKMDRPYL